MKTKLLLIAGFFTAVITQAQIYQSTQTFGASSVDFSQTSAMDAQGNVYSAGNIGSSVTFGPSSVTHRGGNADGYLAKYDPVGNPLWIKSFAGGFDDVVTAMTVAPSGDILLTGYFQGSGTQSFDADPGPSVFNLSQPAFILSRDCFIIKLDSNGDFIWAKQISNPSGGAAQEDSFDIEVGEQGDVYVSGRFILADFDPGPSTQTILTPSNGFEGFILKLDSNGDFVWVNHIKNSQNSVRDIVLDTNGDIIAIGEFNGTIDIAGASATPVNLTSSGANDVFMVKYDPLGNHVWSQKIGGTGADLANVIERTTTGEFVLGGSFNGVMDIDPDPSVTLNVTSNGSTDGYVLALNSNGRINNHYTIGGSAADEVNDILLDYTGKTIVTGMFSGVVDFDTSTATANGTSLGNTDAFMLSLDNNTFLYDTHFTYGGSDNLRNTKVEYNAAQDRLSFLGAFSSTADFNPFAGVDNKTSQGSSDVYLMQLLGAVLSNDGANLDASISMFPNPARDFVGFKSSNLLHSVTIIDMNGRMLFESRFRESATQQNISLPQLKAGIYFVTIQSDLGQKVEKLIVE